jgi:hypothetical protein
VKIAAALLVLLTAVPASAQRPGRSAILGALRTSEPNVEHYPIGRAIAAGPGRFAQVFASPARGSFFELRVAIMSASPVALVTAITLPVDTFFGTVTEGRVELLGPGQEEHPRVATSRLEDLDGDGELELAIAVWIGTELLCGVGGTLELRYYVIDLAPAPSLAASLLVRTIPEEFIPRLEGTVLVEDTNADGHRDLVLRTRTCDVYAESDEQRCTPRERRVFLWNRERDVWEAAPVGRPRAAPCP